MILQNIFSIVFLFSLTVYVRAQTCENTHPSSACSSNAACGCMPLVFAEDIGICGITNVNCARLTPCDADFACPSTNQICLAHSRCGATPICYPMSMADTRLCPPIPTTTTATTWPFFTTEGRATFETTTSSFTDDATATYYTSGTNQPFETTTNGFNENETSTYFNSNATDYEYNVTETSTYFNYNITDYDYNVTDTSTYFNSNITDYDYNVTDSSTYFNSNTTEYDYNVTETSTYFYSNTTEYEYNVTNTTSYPSNLTLSIYSSELNTNSSLNSTTHKYYELIQIRVNTSGRYYIRSVSYIDTFGCIYDEIANSSELGNLSICNDDYNGNQFQIDVYLEEGLSYILNFTTFNQNATGPYTVEVYGVDSVELSHIHVEEVSTTTSFPTNQTESVTTDQSLIMSIYSSSLTEVSPRYSSFSRHYEAINVSVNTSGSYTFRSEETLDGMGYLYRSYFNPSDERQNLLAHDDQSGENNQFSFTQYLEAGMSYVLVFTTYGANVNGPFRIITSGPGRVEFNAESAIMSNTTGLPQMTSEYVSELTTNNSYFNRPSGPGGAFHYEAIEIKTKTLGVYTFISINGSSIGNDSMDTVGYLYSDNFSPFSPSMNLIQSDDDGAGERQFRLMYALESDKKYILVLTTFSQNITGSFSIQATGPGHVNLTRLNI